MYSILKKFTILYVEDEKMISDIVAKLLRKHFKDVYIAYDGKKGLELFKNYLPDIVLTDINIPLLTGLEMSKKIKKLNSEQHIIFFTAFDNTNYLKEAINIGVDKYILKPIDKTQFFNTLISVAKNIEIKNENQALLKKLQNENERFMLIFNHSKDSIIDWDIENREIFYSIRFKEIFQKTIDYTNKNLLDILINIVDDNEKEHFEKKFTLFLQVASQMFFETYFKIKNMEKWVSFNAILKVDKNGNHKRMIIFLHDITEIIQKQKKIEYLAKHDILTNLANRSLFLQLYEKILYINDRQKTMSGLLFIDLDDFKHINDTYGHEMGDKVLQEFAKRLSKITRKGDILARFGGDEFVLGFAELQKQEDVVPLLVRILESISKPMIFTKSNEEILTFKITVSIGVTFYPQNAPIDLEQLLRQADQALYQSKMLGKNRYTFYNQEDSLNLKKSVDMIKRVKEGLENNEFELYYQPQIDLQTDDIIGFEALLRWNKNKECLMPNDYLYLIENDANIMKQIDKYVLEKGFSDIAILREKGLNFEIDFNISIYQFEHNDFLFYVDKLLKKFELTPDNIGFEIIERDGIRNLKFLQDIFKELRNKGFNLGIDKFGNGYATLNCFQSLSTNKIKIDKELIFNLLNDESTLSVVKGSIHLAQAFKNKSVAVGVKNVEIKNKLVEIGCEIGQGNLFSKPIPFCEIVEYYHNFKR